LRHFQVTLDDGLCRKCNNELLGGLGQAVVWNPGRQPALLMQSGSSGRIVYARAMLRGPHRPSRTTALTGWSTGTWRYGAALLEPPDRCMP
jgi:hypothetical protein